MPTATDELLAELRSEHMQQLRDFAILEADALGVTLDANDFKTLRDLVGALYDGADFKHPKTGRRTVRLHFSHQDEQNLRAWLDFWDGVSVYIRREFLGEQ